MTLKTCSKCNEAKSIDQFNKKPSTKDGRNGQCKVCTRLNNKIDYIKKSDKYKANVARRRKEYKLWFAELKSKLKCNRCPENHIACLQFHHTDPSIKEIAVSKAVAECWAKERILAEIEKCEVLCANCHFKEHSPAIMNG